MGHYDSSRDGYCGCGAGPGNIVGGVCNICGRGEPTKPVDKRGGEGPYVIGRGAALQHLNFADIEARVIATMAGPLKDHEIAMVVNTLTAIASEYGQTQQCRDRISRFIVPLLRRVQ